MPRNGIAFGNVRGYRKGRAVQLVDKEVEAARKCLRRSTDLVGKVDRFLVDEKFLECENHLRDRRSE